MEYNFSDIEKKWQRRWKEQQTYKTTEDTNKPKFYVLDMFPYPSGAGLHVGHPLGYIASDIYSRYKRLQGFNVLHPMGYDAFGLPAEQYAIQTGQHPRITTDKNIDRYREQLDKIGFSFDWSREVRTCDPAYYKWTQWAFLQMFASYYRRDEQRARPIKELEEAFAVYGNKGLNAACSEEISFTAEEWQSYDNKEKQEILMHYRLAYLAETAVNWCPALGTVLANDEVKDGLSERGGHPVVQKMMRQWQLRVSAYAERLLNGLEDVDWSDSLKDVQRNWIGRSTGANVRFKLQDGLGNLEIFTTRADTMFGATFMVIAPEHPVLSQVKLEKEVEDYVHWAKNRSERERQAEVKNVSGKFTGLCAENPFTKKQIPVWVSEYVLAGYGTGAIMAVPAHDSRDYAFAKHFGLEIIPLIKGCDVSNESFDAKEGEMINSGFLNGMQVKDAIKMAIDKVEEMSIGTAKVNYRLRDAVFSRQRYWGEPIPMYYQDGIPCAVDTKALPLELPAVDKFLPTETGEPPLGRAKDWTYETFPLELSTMPGFAGSSAYYLRYMDPTNSEALVSKTANHYWRNVDLYIGGTEHATGHLIYSRFWNKFLFDLGAVCEDEPFKKLVNQGMIQGRSNFVYRVVGTNKFVSHGLKEKYETQQIHVDVNIVSNDILNTAAFRASRPEYADAEFILEDGKYLCGYAVEKMSKSMFNVVNPDDVVEKYGADTLRLYEMFLGPLEMAKPWDTNGIDGVHRFLRKLWRLYHDAQNNFSVSDEKATPQELKSLHKLIKKVQDDIEAFSFNTAVSGFMICVNELTELKCSKRDILAPLTVLIAPFAPHIAEELWEALGNTTTVCDAAFPTFRPEMLVESAFEYPVSFNGKLRFKKELPLGLSAGDVEAAVLADEQAAKYLHGLPPKKVIVVPGKIVNIVV